jgi:uncharacterized SAM-binding protein YcdF (DUF218 family)
MRLRALGLSLLVLLVVAIGTSPAWLPAAGRLLLVEDPLAPADIIVVLGGNAPYRLPYAEQLVRQGYAPLVLVSDERVHTFGMDTSWGALYSAGLAGQGIPPSALLLITNPVPLSTVDEAQRAAQVLRERGLHSALLVTDAFHSRRADLLFTAEFHRHGLTVRSVPTLAELDDLEHWWQRPRMARHVLSEYVKLGSYLLQGAYW